MTALLEVVDRLTEQEQREVHDFAEFLLQKRAGRQAMSRKAVKQISFDGWAGCLAHLDKSAVELAHEASDVRVAGAERGT